MFGARPQADRDGAQHQIVNDAGDDGTYYRLQPANYRFDHMPNHQQPRNYRFDYGPYGERVEEARESKPPEQQQEHCNTGRMLNY
jgi:hypothetical protein